MISFEFEGKTYSAKTVKELQKVLEKVGFKQDVAIELDKIAVDTIAKLEANKEGIIDKQEEQDNDQIDGEEQEAIDRIDGEELESFFKDNNQDNN
jgi:hypothetical protein